MPRPSLRWILPFIATVAAVAFLTSPLRGAGSSSLVISEVYGAGGNSGATFTNDYIQIFNRGTASASLNGLSLQYASATGTGNFGSTASQLTALPNVTLQPGQYYLVKEASGANGVSFAADLTATSPISMAAGAGKVALVNSTATLGCNGGSTPCDAAQKALIIDLVGYGNANFFEGSAGAPTIAATTSAGRKSAGCTDTDDNGADFAAVSLNAAVPPATSASTLNVCGSVSPTNPTATASASPTSPAAGDPVAFTVSVTPGQNPTSTGLAVTANLTAIGGSAAQTFSGAGNTFTFSTVVSFATAPGSKSMPVTITDEQGRSGSAFLSLTVTPPVPRLFIHEVQGTGSFSPYAGSLVEVEGVVTARKSNGFFIQAPEAEYDADALTSEGIFVFTSSTPAAAAAVGNRVKVRGTVQDFIPSADPNSSPVTEIAGSPSIVAINAGNALPTAVTLGDTDLNPANALGYLARYEGMRVQVGALQVVAPTDGFVDEAHATATSSGVFFGVLPGVARPFREPGIEVPSPAPAGVPVFDANPERLRVDSDGQVGATAIDVATGALVQNLTGVLDFGSRTYTLDPDPGIAVTVSNNGRVATPVRAGIGEGEITVASFNVERFYDTVNDPSTSDVVLTAQAFANRLAKASLTARNVLNAPDILALMEVENLGALQALANQIDTDAATAGQVPPGYAPYLFEGNDIGGIDVGFLVKTSRVNVVSVQQVGKDATYITPEGPLALLNDRPPLVLKAALKTQGKELAASLTVIANHLRSLSGIDGVDAARIQKKRLSQAEYLASLIEGYQQAGERVVSVGDYNAFDVNDGYVDVINTVRGGTPHPSEDVLGEPLQLVTVPLIDLAAASPTERYSYVFGGNAQILDHIIVSQSFTVNGFQYARANADFPESLRGDATRPERLSDHDAPIAYLAVARDTVAPTVVLSGPTNGAQYLLGTVPAASCTSTDTGGAGLATSATLTVTGFDQYGLGTITATCAGATDNVGNVAAAVSVQYRVVAYTFGGFLAPVANQSQFRIGRAVPLVFGLTDWNGARVTNLATITAIKVAPNATCSGVPSSGWQPAAAVGGTSLTVIDGVFQFNWKTTGLTAGCWTVSVQTVDTLQHTVTVNLR